MQAPIKPKQRGGIKSRLHSMRARTRKSLFGGKTDNIAEAIEKVMQERFKKRQKQQQADQNKRKSSVI